MIEYYFKFGRNTTGKAKTRYELEKFSKPVYEPLNLPFIYFGNTPERIKASQKRKSDFGISQKHWISSIFISDITKPNYAYGDVKSTNDLVLMIIGNDELELFICRGKKSYFQSVMNLFFDDELNEEMNKLRQDLISNDSKGLEPAKP